MDVVVVVKREIQKNERKMEGVDVRVREHVQVVRGHICWLHRD